MPFIVKAIMQQVNLIILQWTQDLSPNTVNLLIFFAIKFCVFQTLEYLKINYSFNWQTILI